MPDLQHEMRDRTIRRLIVGIGLTSSTSLLAGLFFGWPPFAASAAGSSSAILAPAIVCLALVVSVAWMATDLRRLGLQRDHLQKLATTDQLTGLANRRALLEVTNCHYIKSALQSGHLAAISIDLDDFKQINDAYGHHAGDQVLIAAAKRLRTVCPNPEWVFRIGGDEFLCLRAGHTPQEGAEALAARLASIFDGSSHLGPVNGTPSASVGFAVAEANEDWNRLIQRADAAMYRAKRMRRCNAKQELQILPSPRLVSSR